MQGMKAELKYLLSQPLIAKGVIKNYITSGSTSIVDDLLAGGCKLLSYHRCGVVFDGHVFLVNDTMVGLKKAKAGSEMTLIKKKKKKTPQVNSVKKEEFDEEWAGISAAV